jgi:hypothetical protein
MAELGWRALRAGSLYSLALALHPKSALRVTGWIRPFRQNQPVDSDGNPIPWWVYPAISFVEERLAPTQSVLEFGSGHSTLWLAQRVHTILSVETDKQWADRIRSIAPPNVSLTVTSLAKDQLATLPIPSDFRADIVVVDCDGNRIACADYAVRNHLSGSGIVLWDNTDGPDWPNIIGLMKKYGFSEISFVGMTAQIVTTSRTTIFYRHGNCLQI